MFFAYIYYRINRFYFKWDGRRGSTAIVGLTSIQVLWIFDLYLAIDKCYLSRKIILEHKNEIAYSFIALMLLLLAINYKLFDGNYNKYRSKWKNEMKSTSFIRGILIILLIVTPLLLIPIVINS